MYQPLHCLGPDPRVPAVPEAGRQERPLPRRRAHETRLQYCHWRDRWGTLYILHSTTVLQATTRYTLPLDCHIVHVDLKKSPGALSGAKGELILEEVTLLHLTVSLVHLELI